MASFTEVLAFASLVVAALAVFVGPAISAAVARRQVRASLLVANKQIVAPMRQAWINSLRQKVAEALSTAWWYDTSNQDPSGPDREGLAGARVEQKLRFLIQEIELMLNLEEEDHRLLLAQLRRISDAFYRSSDRPSVPAAVEAASATCRRVLKREWNRVKEEIDPNQPAVATQLSATAIRPQLRVQEPSQG